MVTSYPGAVDEYTRPQTTDYMDNPPVTQLFDNLFDAVEAIEQTLGVDPQATFDTVSARIAAAAQSGGTGGGSTNPLLQRGNQVKLVNAGGTWQFPDGTVPDLTGRICSITWEGTAGQIPAQGVADDSFKIGDTALVREMAL